MTETTDGVTRVLRAAQASIVHTPLSASEMMDAIRMDGQPQTTDPTLPRSPKEAYKCGQYDERQRCAKKVRDYDWSHLPYTMRELLELIAQEIERVE